MNDLLTAKDFMTVGYISGLHGYDGTMRISTEPGMEAIFHAKVPFLYFIEDGMFVPRFIRSWAEDRSLVSFERIDAREDARHLTDQKVYLRKSDIPEVISEQNPLKLNWNLLDGFQLWDVEKDVLSGHIHSIEEFPGGWMAEVVPENQSEPFLVPLAEELMDRIDEKNRILYMNLPEGLMEL